jgi:hypothetical protein
MAAAKAEARGGPPSGVQVVDHSGPSTDTPAMSKHALRAFMVRGTSKPILPASRETSTNTPSPRSPPARRPPYHPHAGRSRRRRAPPPSAACPRTLPTSSPTTLLCSGSSRSRTS